MRLLVQCGPVSRPPAESKGEARNEAATLSGRDEEACALAAFAVGH